MSWIFPQLWKFISEISDIGSQNCGKSILKYKLFVMAMPKLSDRKNRLSCILIEAFTNETKF